MKKIGNAFAFPIFLYSLLLNSLLLIKIGTAFAIPIFYFTYTPTIEVYR